MDKEILDYVERNRAVKAYGAEIIRGHEHPAFGIGDTITNGRVNHKVLGYSRGILGLNYVLEEVSFGMFYMLVEDADRIFHLKCHGNMSAPAKWTPQYSIEGDKMVFRHIDTPEKRLAMIKAYESLEEGGEDE